MRTSGAHRNDPSASNARPQRAESGNHPQPNPIQPTHRDRMIHIAFRTTHPQRQAIRRSRCPAVQCCGLHWPEQPGQDDGNEGPRPPAYRARALERETIGMPAPARRSGATANRRDLVLIPIPSALLLRYRLRVRDVRRSEAGQGTGNVRSGITVDRVADDRTRNRGLGFDHANEEAVHRRPLGIGSEGRRPACGFRARGTLPKRPTDPARRPGADPVRPRPIRPMRRR